MTGQVGSSKGISIADGQGGAESISQGMIALFLPAIAANMISIVGVVLAEIESFDRCFGS